MWVGNLLRFPWIFKVLYLSRNFWVTLCGYLLGFCCFDLFACGLGLAYWMCCNSVISVLLACLLLIWMFAVWCLGVLRFC